MGRTSQFLKKRWKVIVNIVTIAALVIFLFAIRNQLIETIEEITHIRWWWLLLFIPLIAWKYDVQARLYQGLFMIVGNRFRYRQMYETALELNFVNTVFPSGGVSGISYYGVRMRSENVTGGKATLVQILKLGLQFLSFEILLAAGLLALAISGDVNVFLFMLTVILATLLVVGTAFMAYVMAAKTRITLFHRAVKSLVNGAYKLATRGRGERKFALERMHSLLLELHNNFKTIHREWRELKKPFVYALLTSVAEIMTIYCVYLAFGQWVNIGAIILAYSVANFAGFVSVLPGGVGVYEALMTTVLVAAGIPAAVSLSVTIMFRVLSTIMQLVPGYYFYHRTIHRGHKLTSDSI